MSSNIFSSSIFYLPEEEVDQLSMEFEWLNEDGEYTTNDQGIEPEPTLTIASTSAIAGQYITISNPGVSSWTTISDTTGETLDKIIVILRELQDRLLVVEEKDEEYFEGRTALKKAYDKFRMLEALYGKKKDE